MNHFLSFLPTREAVEASVLSKKWYHLYACFPISDLSESFVWTSSSAMEDFRKQDRRQIFLNFVDHALLRQCHHNKYIPRFQIDITRNNSQLCSYVDHWLGLAAQCGVKELDVYFMGILLIIFFSKPSCLPGN